MTDTTPPQLIDNDPARPASGLENDPEPAPVPYDETLVYNPGTIVLWKGQIWKVCKNQALYNLVTNKLHATKALTSGITSESQHAFTARRREKAMQAAAAGLARVAAPTSQDAVLDAWSLIIEKQARLALSTDRGRDSTGAAKFVGSAAGLYGGKDAEHEQKQQQTTIILSDSVANQLINALFVQNDGGGMVVDNCSYQQQDVIDITDTLKE